MKEFKEFKTVQLSKPSTLKVVGGSCPYNSDCEGPITELGTISNDGDN